MEKDSKIYVAGHSGLVGSAICRNLKENGYRRILTVSHGELDLTCGAKAEEFMRREKPEYVILAAARVGGIRANSNYPAEFIYQNTMIQANVMDLAHRYGVRKLLFLASSCVYPKYCAQPMTPEYLFTGMIEPTNEPYGMAKLIGIKTAQAYNKQYGANFISAIPANVYGINDHFDENGHVTASLIEKFHKAKLNGDANVVIWGSGRPRREFFFSDDLGEACVFLMNNYDDDTVINIGCGKDASIMKLAELIKEIAGYEGEIVRDTTKPDGIPQRLLDSSRINSLGWKAKTSLEDGLRATYDWYENFSKNTAPSR